MEFEHEEKRKKVLSLLLTLALCLGMFPAQAAVPPAEDAAEGSGEAGGTRHGGEAQDAFTGSPEVPPQPVRRRWFP